VVASLRKATRLPLDVHLMIERPEEYIEDFVRAGSTRVLVHQEATVHLDRALAMIREGGAEAGAVINPATPVAMLGEILDRVDTVLVMSVNPGFGGQKFIPGAVEKIRQLNQWRSRYNGAFRIEVGRGSGSGKHLRACPGRSQHFRRRVLRFLAQATRPARLASCASLPPKH
jgi:ribulose-phosphate 3-epimerase